MKNKQAAMEMSVGTIVTIVLLMSVLVLGIFLVQKIFKSSSSAVDSVDSQIQSEINKLFSEEGQKLVIYPSSREISIKKGDTPKGFGFAVLNKDVEEHTFTYTIESEPNFDFTGKCGSTFSKEEADSWLLANAGTFDLGPGDSLEPYRLVKFNVPETAPPCTIPYNLNIDIDGKAYSGADVYLSVK